MDELNERKMDDWVDAWMHGWVDGAGDKWINELIR